MAFTLIGTWKDWSMTVDEEAHREYEVSFLVETDDPNDGPFLALQTPGLPSPLSEWSFGNDFDPWATRLWEAEVTPLVQGQKNLQFLVKFKYSTSLAKRCRNTLAEDPLLEPAKVSGSSSKYTEEAVYDRFGRPIVTSSHEQIRGAQNEWDMSKGTIRIEQNVATIYQAYVLPTIMENTVNDAYLWGMARRCVKLSEHSFERLFYGSCSAYYRRSLEFELSRSGFDRTMLDEGQKALNGYWNPATGSWVLKNIAAGVPPDPDNPTHFIQATDRNGNIGKVILDGFGEPWVPANVLTCNQCPLGSPRYWRVLNFSAVPYLEYVADCNWYGEAPAGVSALDLDVVGTNYVAEYTSFGVVVGTWSLPISSWSCDGYNAMTRLSGEVPDQLWLSNAPGSIRVEKYHESNFALLGVPLLF